MNRSIVRATAVFLLTVPVLSGCATYVATPINALTIGQPVRVSLTRQAFDALPRISDLPGSRYAGTLVRKSDAELVVRVPIAIGSPLGQEVIIPTEGITQTEIRAHSKGRTTLVVLAGVAVVVGAVLSTNHNGPLQEAIPDNTSHDENPFGALARAISISFPLP